MPLNAEQKKHLEDSWQNIQMRANDDAALNQNELLFRARAKNNAAAIPNAYSEAALYRLETTVRNQLTWTVGELEAMGVAVDSETERFIMRHFNLMCSMSMPLHFPPGLTATMDVSAHQGAHARARMRLNNQLLREAAAALRSLALKARPAVSNPTRVISEINPGDRATLHDSVHKVLEHPYLQTSLSIIGGLLFVYVDGRWLALFFPLVSFALHRSKVLSRLTRKAALIVHILITTTATVCLFLLGILVNDHRTQSITPQQLQAVVKEAIKNQAPLSSSIEPSKKRPTDVPANNASTVVPTKEDEVRPPVPLKHVERTLRLTAQHPSDTREATIVAPGANLQNYNVFYIDTSDFVEGGTLTIQISISPTSGTYGSFDLFPADVSIPTHGLPTGTLVGSYDVPTGSSTRIIYHFWHGQVFALGLGGNWGSPAGSRGSVEFRATVTQ